jgi:transcriptional regulator with XRE-family HTH domain
MTSAPSVFDGLGRVLRDLRIEKGFTQVELAERAEISKSMLSLYETEKSKPHLNTLERLVAALDVSLVEVARRMEEASLREPSTRRGPKGKAPRASLPGNPHEEAAAAVVEVLHLVAALIRSALPPEPGSATDASQEQGDTGPI